MVYETATATGASHDIYATKLSSENEIWKEVISAANDAALQIISLYNHKGSCSNAELAYCIKVTVPIPVVAGEQSELFQN
jgi:predicted DNA-binding protein with PD1-like motif